MNAAVPRSTTCRCCASSDRRRREACSKANLAEYRKKLDESFVMKDMTKTFPGAQKPVLSNINLQFYQGAKIGIVGPNGAGKSTLIKIMAGIDKDYTGEAWPGENITVGYLEQEPQLDPTKDVFANVMDGVAETRALLTRFEEVSARLGEELRLRPGDPQHGVRQSSRYHRTGLFHRALPPARNRASAPRKQPLP